MAARAPTRFGAWSCFIGSVLLLCVAAYSSYLQGGIESVYSASAVGTIESIAMGKTCRDSYSPRDVSFFTGVFVTPTIRYAVQGRTYELRGSTFCDAQPGGLLHIGEAKSVYYIPNDPTQATDAMGRSQAGNFSAALVLVAVILFLGGWITLYRVRRRESLGMK